MKKLIPFVLLSILAMPTMAADYIIDTRGSHASIQFKVSHLGYSWLFGRFNTFGGSFSYDKNNPSASTVTVDIDTASVDSNHAERDKHLKSDDFLDVKKFPKSKFVSTRFEPLANGKAKLHGKFTLHGVTNNMVIDIEKIGQGADPWGGQRVGFYGTTRFAMKDYGITKNLGPASTHVNLMLAVEGIKKK